MKNIEDRNELVPVEAEATSLIPTTDVQGRVDMMLSNRGYIVEKVKPLLMEGVDVYTLPGMKKPSLGKPGAEKLAAIFGLTAKFEVDKETMEMIGKEANGKPYIAYVCNLSRSGRVAGQGRGATFIEWMRNSYRMIFSDQYNALTPSDKEKCQGPFTGTSKSNGKPYTYWRMPDDPVFDSLALNKAIKMAQKSAFVDAVIRTTGMSDLFTQDLEDMRSDEQEQAHVATAPANGADEPFPGKPAYETKREAKDAAFSSPEGIEQPVPETVPTCDLCGSLMKKRNGARGPFWGCGAYPKCTNIKTI